MVARKKTTPVQKTTPVRRRRTTTTKRKTTPVRRRRTTTKKRGLGDLFTRNEAQAGFEQLVGVAGGYIIAENGGKFLNPNGDKNNLEIGAKLAAGFLISTTGRMPSVGAGIMASGVKKLFEVNQGLADAAGIPGTNTQYLSQAPTMRKTPYVLADNGEVYLSEYAPAYQSNQY